MATTQEQAIEAPVQEIAAASQPKLLSKVSFVITGFGPFRNAPENPTMILVQHLESYLEQHAPHLKSQIATTRIIETSVQAAQKEIDDLYKSHDETKDGSTTTVFLHLGVNYRGSAFQLEQCAYNDASFRIPDERGYQPKQCRIVEGNKLGSKLDTTLPLEQVCVDMQQRLDPSSAVVLSTDPGRFVCNYTYYLSLDQCKARNETTVDEQMKPCFYALFLHVPPFRVAPEEVQLQVIVQLLEAINRRSAYTF
jgi:pyroglutamyl-peptidase